MSATERSPISDQGVRLMSPQLRSRVEFVGETGGSLIRFVGVAPVPQGPVVIRGTSDWIVLHIGADPQVHRGTLAIPPAARRHLAKVVARGIDFDGLFIAHELAPGDLDRLGEQNLSPRQVDELVRDPLPDEAGQRAVLNAARVFRSVADGLLSIAEGLVAVPLAGGVSLALDPVLFGCVTADGVVRTTHPAAFFYLTRWV